MTDDAQWLDRVSVEVLGFVARRLFADRVGMLFAVREEDRIPAVLEGLSQLRITGLPADVADALPAQSAGQPLEERVSQRIVAETGGNPLALVEFGGELTADERSGAVPLHPLRFGGRLAGCREGAGSGAAALPAVTGTRRCDMRDDPWRWRGMRTLSCSRYRQRWCPL